MDPTIGVALAAKLFLGEAYPSGNAYLQAFVASGAEQPRYETRPKLETLPSAVALYCLQPAGCRDAAVGDQVRTGKRGEFLNPELKKVVDPATKNQSVVYDYIPAREGLDASHQAPCHLPYKKNPAYRYAEPNDDDFFSTIGDYCYSDELVVRYRLDAPSKSTAYQVIGVAAGVELEEVKRHAVNDDKVPAPKRPMTKDEAATVAKAKQADARTKDKDECSTQRAYRDSASVMMTAKIKGTSQSIRVSFYANPGCAGHLGNIYVLDVLDGSHLVSTSTLSRYLGVL